MKKSILIFFIFQYILVAYSQSTTSSPLAVSISLYADNAIHPGFKVGGYYDLNVKEKSKERRFNACQEKKGNKIKQKTFYGKISMGGYSFANNHNGWFGNIGLGYERLRKRTGWIFGECIEAGYLFRDYKIETYTMNNNKIEIVPFGGSGGVVYSLSPYLGRDFSIKSNLPIKIQIKPVLQLMAYSYSFVSNSAIELEFIYHF